MPAQMHGVQQWIVSLAGYREDGQEMSYTGEVLEQKAEDLKEHGREAVSVEPEEEAVSCEEGEFRSCADTPAELRSDASADDGEVADGHGAIPLDPLGLERHVMRSTLGCPFIVVSSGQLVEAVPPPSSPAQVRRLVATVQQLVNGYEADRTVLVADFEGEMLGYGGELITAAFVPTPSVEPGTLRKLETDEDVFARYGLLLDMRCDEGINLVRQIMESFRITKLIWGADSDISSLRFQAFPREVSVKPHHVVDVQLAFSTPSWRLGLARALAQVPSEITKALPDKKGIDFDGPHSKNRRALVLPLGEQEARYAADDLHRVEAVLRSLKPEGGTYQPAKAVTDQVAANLAADPAGLQKLERDLNWFKGLVGMKREKRAVEIARHVTAVRARKVQLLPQQEQFLTTALERVQPTLQDAGIVIPPDLSFAGG